VTAEPILIPLPLPASIERRRATPERSITRAGLSKPFLSWGSRSVPPASSLDSGPPLARALMHSSTLSGRISSNRRTRGLHVASRLIILSKAQCTHSVARRQTGPTLGYLSTSL